MSFGFCLRAVFLDAVNIDANCIYCRQRCWGLLSTAQVSLAVNGVVVIVVSLPVPVPVPSLPIPPPVS